MHPITDIVIQTRAVVESDRISVPYCRVTLLVGRNNTTILPDPDGSSKVVRGIAAFTVKIGSYRYVRRKSDLATCAEEIHRSK